MADNLFPTKEPTEPNRTGNIRNPNNPQDTTETKTPNVTTPTEPSQQDNLFPTPPQTTLQSTSQNNNVSKEAKQLASAIEQVESGGDPTAQGASGESGAFQFMPGTWERVSKEVAGQELEQTPENERRVAEKKVDQLLNRGFNEREVAKIWNTSLGGEEKPKTVSGVNEQGVEFDSEEYADKVTTTLASQKQDQQSPFVVNPNETQQQDDGFFAPEPGNVRIRDVVRELPGAAADTAGNIVQDFLRGGAAGFNALGEVGEDLSDTVAFGLSEATGVGDIDRPGDFTDVFDSETVFGDDSDVTQTLFGDRKKDVTIDDFGKGFLESLGVENPSSEMSVPTGLALAGIDWVPGVSGGQLRSAAKQISNTKNLDEIVGLVDNVIDGNDEEVRILASGLRKIDNTEDAEAVVREAASDSDDWIQALRAAGNDEMRLRPSASKTEIDNALSRMTEDGVDQATIEDQLRRIGVGSEGAIRRQSDEIMQRFSDENLSPFDVRQRVIDDLLPENPSNQLLRRTGRIFTSKRRGKRPFQDISRGDAVKLEKRLGFKERSARISKAAARKEINKVRNQVSQLAREHLPKSMRGGRVQTLVQRVDPNLPEGNQYHPDNVVQEIEDMVDMRRQAEQLSKQEGELRQKVSFMREMGQFNQTAVNDAKSAVGVNKPISQMEKPELERLFDELQQRVQFKEGRGLETRRSLSQREPETPSQQDYDTIPELEKERPGAVGKVQKTWDSFKQTLSETFVPLMTRLENVDPGLKQLVRNELDIELPRQIKSDVDEVDEAWTTIKDTLDENTWKQLDFAMQNAHREKINEIADNNPAVADAVGSMRRKLDEIYANAKEAGIDVEYRRNFFPRWIVNTDGFVDDMLSQGDQRVVDEAFQNFQNRMGREPSDIERQDILNKMVRGYDQYGVGLSDPSATRKRVIENISPEMSRYYANTGDAMKNYVKEMRKSIAQKKLLGKQVDAVESYDLAEDGMELTSTIGSYIDDALRSGKIDSKEELEEVYNVLNARLNPGYAPAWASTARSGTYAGILANPRSVLTQIEDMAVTLYENGMLDTFKGLYRTATGNTRVDYEDTGLSMGSIDMDEVGQFENFSGRMMEWSGFQKMENLTNEAMIEATLLNAERNASKNLSEIPQGKYSVYDYAREFYGEGTDDYDEFIEKAANGTVDDDVLNYAISKILDYRPVSQSEMPEKYVTGNMSKIAYTLQSFTLKRMDTVRREIIQEAKRDPQQAMKNLVRFSAFVGSMGIGVDKLQDWIMGNEQKETDQLLTENLMKIAGPSKYLLDQIEREGFGSAVGDTMTVAAEPAKAFVNDIADAVGGDVDNIQDLETTRLLPLFGLIINERFGDDTEGLSPSGSGGGGDLFPGGETQQQENLFPGSEDFGGDEDLFPSP